ncbi:hypothetical protein PZA11_007957 [Diplocarpon coronariae]
MLVPPVPPVTRIRAPHMNRGNLNLPRQEPSSWHEIQAHLLQKPIHPRMHSLVPFLLAWSAAVLGRPVIVEHATISHNPIQVHVDPTHPIDAREHATERVGSFTPAPLSKRDSVPLQTDSRFEHTIDNKAQDTNRTARFELTHPANNANISQGDDPPLSADLDGFGNRMCWTRGEGRMERALASGSASGSSQKIKRRVLCQTAGPPTPDVRPISSPRHGASPGTSLLASRNAGGGGRALLNHAWMAERRDQRAISSSRTSWAADARTAAGAEVGAARRGRVMLREVD